MSTKEDRKASRKQALEIVEKYDTVVNYLYKIIQNFPRSHGVFRDEFLKAIFAVPKAVYDAAKSNQISQLRFADSALANVRWCVRFSTHPERKLITPKQQEVTESLLAEVGKMIGAWIVNRSKR